MWKIVIKGIALSLLVAITSTIQAAITIVSPTQNQVVAPGSVLDVQLAFPDGFVPTELIIMSGGELDIGIAERYVTGPFEQLSVSIQADMTGPKTLRIEAKDANNVWEEGEVQVVIIPQESPDKLEPLNPYALLLAPPAEVSSQTVRLGVQGIYLDGTERNLESSLVGTTYTSSEPSVVTVDDNGNLQAVAPGAAIVTAEHRGVRAYIGVEVGDGITGEVPAIDLSGDVSINGSGFRYDSDDGVYVQQISITNQSSKLLQDSLVLVIYNMPEGVRLKDADKTRHLQPLGEQYVLVGAEEYAFLPGSTITQTLKFENIHAVPIRYLIAPYWSSVNRR